MPSQVSLGIIRHLPSYCECWYRTNYIRARPVTLLSNVFCSAIEPFLFPVKNLSVFIAHGFTNQSLLTTGVAHKLRQYLAVTWSCCHFYFSGYQNPPFLRLVVAWCCRSRCSLFASAQFEIRLFFHWNQGLQLPCLWRLVDRNVLCHSVLYGVVLYRRLLTKMSYLSQRVLSKREGINARKESKVVLRAKSGSM